MTKERVQNQIGIRVPLPLKLAAIEACLDQDRALATVVVDALTEYLTARGYLPANEVTARQPAPSASESGV